MKKLRPLPESDPTHRWASRFLCLVMAAITGCAAPRSQFVWHDLGAESRGGAPKSAPEPGSWGSEPEPADVSDPLVAPGFLLTLHFLEDKTLNGDFRVDFDGNLTLPYNIIINTRGLSISQLRKRLIGLYRPFFKTSAGIDLQVRERKYWLDVRGLVLKPGRFLVDPNTSLDQVILTAGGLDKETPPQFIRIQKGQKSFSLDLNRYYSRGESHPQILGWLGGEVLFFQKEIADSMDEQTRSTPYRSPIYLLGEVRKPGEYLPKGGAEFIDFIAQAGGFTDRADLNKLEIIRRNDGRARDYMFSWDGFQRAPKPLQGDVIMVHAEAHDFERGMSIATLILTVLTSLAFVFEMERANSNNRRP